MIVYRITGTKHASEINGSGAAIYPGRWNKYGTPVLYTGEIKEIALLENLVHVSAGIVPDLSILTIEIPDDSISELKIHKLPSNWTEYPAPSSLVTLGENWVVKGLTIALKVPSCIITTSHNIILNCRHKEYKKVKVLNQTKFNFDLRLMPPRPPFKVE